MCLAIIPAALVRSPCTSEVGHRPPCDDPDRVREGYEKSTIAGDDPKAFRDKYRFTLHGETGTDLCKIWAAMQREAYKSEGSKPPSSKPLKNHCSLAQAFARSIFCFSPAMAMLAWAGCGVEDGMPSEVCHAAPSDVGTLGWERLPEDGKWYVLQRGVVCCMDAFGGTTAWPNLAAGAKGWKADMRAPAENFARLLRQFGAEIHCSFCTIQSASSWDSHCSSDKHFKEVYEVVEQCREVAREELWQQVSVLGGTLKYNHLDGEVQARRTALEPTLSITRLEDLQHTEGWVRVGQIACVSTTPASLKDDWPNLWSLRHWKEKMEPVVTRAMRVLEANQDPYSLRCMICPDQSFSREHLLGPKHYSQLVQVIHDKHRDVVNRDQFWQQWICQCGAVAFNHIDGCCNMVSKPSSSASSSVAKDAHHDNSSQRTSAGSPSPSLDTGGTSSFDGEAAAEAYHYASLGQKPCPSLPGASTPVATTPSFTNHRNVDHNRRPPPPPPGSPPPVSANDMQSCEGQLPRQESLSLSSWLWRKHVGSKASLLASRLSAAGVPESSMSVLSASAFHRRVSQCTSQKTLITYPRWRS